MPMLGTRKTLAAPTMTFLLASGEARTSREAYTVFGRSTEMLEVLKAMATWCV